jgi:hypothetical protein
MANRFPLDQLENALTLLGDRLHLAGLPAQELVVCGGTSLIARGFVSRATKDVDILARRTAGTEFVSARELPPEFLIAASRVAADLGLPDNWINNGPVDLFEMGMPKGFSERLEAKTYGHLTAWYIGRTDQIHLKLYAAVDRGPGPSRHMNDLLLLTPTGDELFTAANWAMTHDVSPGFKELLKLVLTEMQHDAVAARL